MYGLSPSVSKPDSNFLSLDEQKAIDQRFETIKGIHKTNEMPLIAGKGGTAFAVDSTNTNGHQLQAKPMLYETPYKKLSHTDDALWQI